MTISELDTKERPLAPVERTSKSIPVFPCIPHICRHKMSTLTPEGIPDLTGTWVFVSHFKIGLQ